ncbi:MAG TPA: phosphoglucosamine mutase [Candidatus Baltobacteraceae bacterium]|jgi:phosphoglucosamine mutase|nr:phosphoglucosamine mutase [Candidatus Baltobacteraceae bacterium]
MGKFFGTDGVRGVANSELTPELAFAIGRAGATVLAHSSERHRPVIVGRDTRLSGTMLEAAIVAGVTSVGRDVVSVGIVPTPAIAAITVRTGAAAGIMISASHNPIADNGIKFFGPDGFKLSDAEEDEIESLLDAPDLPRPTGTEIGVASVAQNLGKHYYEELYKDAADLSGLTVVVDAAFGAAYAYAPYALRKLGATVHEMNCENDGSRINVDCGATNLRPLAARVRELIESGKTHVIGVAFDGDADRAMFVDETGKALSGDHVMLILASDMRSRGVLAGDTVVATVMSNIGLEKALAAHGISLVRSAVGDRYVLERMREGGFVLGGEQSGHIINLLNNTTGDGPMTAISLFSTVIRQGRTLHELASELTVYPQVLVNVQTSFRDVLQNTQVRKAIQEAETILTGNGRLLIRPSGTEPLIRVMVEGDDQQRIEQLARALADAIRQASAALDTARR